MRSRARCTARGAELILTGRRSDVLEPLAAELGARALAVDLAERSRDSSAWSREAGRRGHPRRQRRAARLRAARLLLHRELDRALDVNLRAPIVLAHALTPGMLERGARTPGVHLLAVGKAATRRHRRSTTRPSSGCAASPSRMRASCATAASASRRSPGLHPRRGHVRRGRASSCRPASARARPRTSPRRWSRAIEHNRGEIDVAPLPLRASTALGASPPSSPAALARRLGSEQIARRHGSRPARQALSRASEQRLLQRLAGLASQPCLRRCPCGSIAHRRESSRARSRRAAPSAPDARVRPWARMRHAGRAPRSAARDRGAGQRSQPMNTSRTSPRRCSATPPMLVAPACCGALEQRLDLLRRVVDARHQRRDQHARRDARAVQLRDRLQARPRVRRVRLGRAPRLLVERRDRQARAEARPARRFRASASRSRSSSGDFVSTEHGLAASRSASRCPASAGSGPRPTGRGRCWCPARRAPASTTVAPARRAAPPAR